MAGKHLLPPTRSPNATLTACIYQTSASDLGVGHFVRGVTLDAAASAKLRTALAGAGPTTACTAQRQFAVVRPRPGGDWVNVELGGCWRALRNEMKRGIGAADPAVVRALLGIK